MEWFRMWHGTPVDEKLRVVARRVGQPMVVVVGLWHYLLDYASQSDDRGSLEGLDVEVVSLSLELDEETIRKTLDALEEKGRISNGRITNWEKRQPKREDSSSERVRKHRGKNDVTQCNAVKRNVTQSNAPEKIQRREDTEKKKEDNKKHYSEFVCMTEKEHASLVERFGEDDAQRRIERLDCYLGSTGRKYKSHYHTILVWAQKDPPTPKAKKEDDMPSGTIIPPHLMELYRIQKAKAAAASGGANEG